MKEQKTTTQVVSMKINQPRPLDPPQMQKQVQEKSLKTEEQKTQDAAADQQPKEETLLAEHYEASGKIDPFAPLIQDRSVEQPLPSDDIPKRILTPLEKIELSQIRLVAVIVMKDKRIAMVEEASGKGYEVGVGTYIGKSQGRIAQIKDNSIVIKEPVRDFRGRLSENIQEIKLHKNDGEE